MLQQKIYNLINRDRKGMWASRIYDWYMLVIIIASIVPLMFIEDYPVFRIIEIITVIAFIIDYILRWATSNLQLKKGNIFPLYGDSAPFFRKIYHKADTKQPFR